MPETETLSQRKLLEQDEYTMLGSAFKGSGRWLLTPHPDIVGRLSPGGEHVQRKSPPLNSCAHPGIQRHRKCSVRVVG